MSEVFTRNLICELTDEERLDYGKDLSAQHLEKKRVEAEKKDSMDVFKNRLGGIESEIETLSTKVRTGQEHRSVDCIWLMDSPKDGYKQTKRLDTGEIVSDSMMEMTADDKQLKFKSLETVQDSDEEQSPYLEGQEAFELGKSEETNPYEDDSDEFIEWTDGWQDAQKLHEAEEGGEA